MGFVRCIIVAQHRVVSVCSCVSLCHDIAVRFSNAHDHLINFLTVYSVLYACMLNHCLQWYK